MENSIVKHPMSNKMGLEIFNYMMETSRRILELSEISRNSDIGVADELNLIASNMAHHANNILHEYCDHGIIETVAKNNLKVYNGETKNFSVKSYEAAHPEMVRYLTEIGIDDQVLKDAKKDYDIIGNALKMASISGYGFASVNKENINIDKPEVVKSGNKYG